MLVNFFNSLLCDKEQCDFTISETLKEVHISITSNKLILNTNFDDILKSFIYKNDTLIDLTFKINENDPVYFYNKNDFFEEIKSSRFFNDSFNDSEEIVEKLDIRISKKIVNNILSIYNLDAFEDYLDNLSLDSILINLFKIPNFLNFLILDSTNYNVPLTFSSKFSLITNESDAINNYNTSRLTICLNKRNETCNFLNASKYDFIPYDFKFNNYANRTIYILMDKLQIIMSLIYTFDMSVISNENILEITMFGSGFKTFSIDFKNADFSKLNNIYEIFDWSYCNETTDKILITKNILGSYFISKNDLYISNDLITTIKSNHKIYLKENIDKYIDIKKSIVDSLLKVETDLLDLLNQFTDSFIKNLGMILTFIFSLILLNSFSDKRFSNIFTKDVTLISLGIVAISCAYLWITIKDITFKKDILDLTKSKIQKNYYSILSENEVNEILELEESDSKDIVINFKKKIKIYEIFWIITIVVFFIIIFVLGFQHFKWCFYYLYNFIKSLL